MNWLIKIVAVGTLLIASPLQAYDIKDAIIANLAAGDNNRIVVGNTTIGGTSTPTLYDSSRARKMLITVPAGGTTITHGYIYAASAVAGASVDISFTFFETDGTLIELHAGSGFSTSDSPDWVGGEFATPVVLAAGTYAMQSYSTGNYRYYFDDVVESGNAYGEYPAVMAPDASTRLITMIGANYAVY